MSKITLPAPFDQVDKPAWAEDAEVFAYDGLTPQVVWTSRDVSTVKGIGAQVTRSDMQERDIVSPGGLSIEVWEAPNPKYPSQSIQIDIDSDAGYERNAGARARAIAAALLDAADAWEAAQ